MATHLPFDIQLQILKRLPVKSLIQFRSVCKVWKSLIDSSHVIAGYSLGHNQLQHLVICQVVEHGEESGVKHVSFVDDDTFPQQKFALTVPHLVQGVILGSSHGLLFLVGYFGNKDSCPNSETDIVVVIWNPAIRKSIDVAIPNLVHDSFDFVVGFGVCPDTKDPRLVKITHIDDYRKIESISSIPCQVMVFTLSSGEWTTSSCTNLPRKSIEFTWYQTVIGQFIYWLAYDWVVGDGKYCNMIMSFDMSTHEFREIDLPDSLAEPCEPELSVSRLKESLVVFEYSDVGYNTDSWKQVCVVWMMDDGDSKAFTKLFTINPPNASVLRTLGFRKSGEPILVIEDDDRDYDKPNALVVYEPCLEHIKDLGICGDKQSFSGSSYTESLLLLDHDDVRCGSRAELTFGTRN